MPFRLCHVILVAALIAAPTGGAYACGASLFGGAEGAMARSWRAPQPARVVLYVDATLDRRGLGDPAAFGRALARSGHEVTLARTPDELARLLDAGSVDVVVADLEVMDSVAADARRSGSAAALLPIVPDVQGRLEDTPVAYERALAHDADLRDALRAIDALVSRRAGS
jgi:hypothetical protein